MSEWEKDFQDYKWRWPEVAEDLAREIFEVAWLAGEQHGARPERDTTR